MTEFVGKVEVKDSAGRTTIALVPDDHTHIRVHDKAAKQSIYLNGADRVIKMLGPSNISINLDGASGQIGVHDSMGKRRILLDPNAGSLKEYSALFLGEGKAGIAVIRNHGGFDAISLDGA